jgi:hypothetical protein
MARWYLDRSKTLKPDRPCRNGCGKKARRADGICRRCFDCNARLRRPACSQR